MASRYYNPRLATSLGAAQGERYVSLEPAVAGARQIIQRGVAERKRNELLKIKQRQEEAKAFAEEMERIDDVLYTVQKNLADEGNLIEKAAPAIKARVTALATLAKDNYDILQTGIKKGQIKRGAAIIWQDENVNKYIKDAKDLLESWPEIIGNTAANPPSVVNPSTVLKISRRKMEGAFTFDKEGMANIYDDDGKTILKKMSIDELKNLDYIPVDTEAFTTAFSAVNTAADKAASKGKSLDGMLADVDAALSGLNFTPQQTLSIAFDYLAKERPEYADLKKYTNENGEIDTKKFVEGIDLDGDGGKGDGVPGEPEDLNLWVKQQLKDAAAAAYEGYQKDYEDKFSTDDKQTESDKKRIQLEKNVEFAVTQLAEIKVPITSKGMIDVDSVYFNNLLNDLNLSADKGGAYQPKGTDIKIIPVKSNVTNKILNFSTEMTEAQFNRAVLILSGATPEEAMRRFPDQSGPVEESEAISIGNLPIKKS